MANIKYIVYLAAVISVIVMVMSICALVKAEKTGNELGEKAGTLAGNTIGSFNGITKGIEEGKKAGKEAGLSAVDTTVDIGGSLKETGKLEVLVASVAITNINKIGDFDDPDYASLYVVRGNAYFTVDLSLATIYISEDNSSVSVEIPSPDVSIFLNERENEKLDEHQNTSFTGNSKDGYKEYVNSMAEIDQNIKENIINYKSLMEQAEAASLQRVEELVYSICGGGKTVNVRIKESE